MSGLPLLNRERSDSFLGEHNLDALVSASRINSTYLTGFNCLDLMYDRKYNVIPGSGDDFVQAYGIYTRTGEEAIVLPSNMFFVSKLQNIHSNNIFTYGKYVSMKSDDPKFDTDLERECEAWINIGKRNFESFQDALESAINDLLGPESSIGFDFGEASPDSTIRLQRRFPQLKIKRANELFKFLRMVKSEEEINRLSKASNINEAALSELVLAIKPGVTEIEAKKTYAMSVISKNGSFKDGQFMIPHGSKAGAMTKPVDIPFRAGTSGWLDIECSFEGYYSDIADTISFGKPAEKTERLYEVLTRAIERCEEIAVPGMRCSELNFEVSKIWEGTGIARPPTGMGHGLGLEVHEYPRISAAKGDRLNEKSAIKDDFIQSSVDIPLEEGMVLAFEAPVMIWGWGGVHVERNVLLAKNGTKRLSAEPRNLRLI